LIECGHCGVTCGQRL